MFRNYVRIEPLDRHGGEEAITGPLQTYGAWIGRHLDIEARLVDAVLDQVSKPKLDRVSDPTSDDPEPPNARVEAAFLQLVMQRLWLAERGRSSRLRLSTLEELDGAARIIRGYLDGIVDSLEPSERALADRIFDQLVTGSGFRIALPAVDLAERVKTGAKRVESLLEQLSSGDVRLLHRFPAPDQIELYMYEVSHDKMAEAMLARRERLRRERALRARSWLTALPTLTILASVVCLLALALRSIDWTLVAVSSGGLAVALAVAWLLSWLRARKPTSTTPN